VIIIIAVLIIVISQITPAASRRKRFRKIFGFEPPIKSDGEEGIRLLQPDVNDVLRKLAQAIDQEERTYAMDPTPDYKLERMRNLRRMHAEFSEVLSLAGQLGFETKQTNHEYLKSTT